MKPYKTKFDIYPKVLENKKPKKMSPTEIIDTLNYIEGFIYNFAYEDKPKKISKKHWFNADSALQLIRKEFEDRKIT